MQLYKYVAPSGIDILLSARLRITPPSHFNDPFDFAPALSALTSPSDLTEAMTVLYDQESRQWYEETVRPVLIKTNPEKSPDEFTYEALQESGLDLPTLMCALISSYVEDIKPTFPFQLQNRLGEELGVVSLTEISTSIVMWAHYAASSAGFVAAFDSESAFFERLLSDSPATGIMPVEYASARPHVTLFDTSDVSTSMSEHVLHDTFFVKSREWSYEKEWRLVRSLEEAHRNDSGQYFLTFPPEMLTAIILGPRTASSLRHDIASILREYERWSHVRLFEALPSPYEYELTLRELPRGEPAA